jgi:uncharacterized protein
MSWAARTWEIDVSVLEQLQINAREALKAGRKEEVGSLRLLISELQKAAKDARHELDGDAELQVLKRERKKRVEAAEAYRTGGRLELAEHEEREAVLIDGFLPQQLDEAALLALIDTAIADVGATSPREMGKVMSAVMAKAGAQVDGKLASRLVKERLSA